MGDIQMKKQQPISKKRVYAKKARKLGLPNIY